MPYRSPVEEIEFVLRHVSDYDALLGTDRFEEAGYDTVSAVLTEAAKISDEHVAPLNRGADLEPAHLEYGVVRTAPGFDAAYDAFREGGWIGIAADPKTGGMGLPGTLQCAVNDMLSGACLGFQLLPLLSQGQIESLQAHASDEIKSAYIPKLLSGDWAGTMNLTEPQAGSDVGAVRTKAEPNSDGTFAISGQKIFISWGDHELAENICHLVLARLPDAAPGTKGISMFMVPKFLPDTEGNIGARNAVRTVSLEHKLGLHGSPTAVMEYDDATGWLVGAESGGMAAMFTMMNAARLAVGLQGVGVAEAATQAAVAFAAERKQGEVGGRGTIIEFPDVRRMLTGMKADVFAARSINYACAVALDMGHATGSEEWSARGAFLTPIAKAFGSDIGVEVASQGVQVHGGMGYVEETGAAQYLRDARITPIYEGTNGIQAMDLVARKMSDDGEVAFRLLDEIEAGAEAVRGEFPVLGDAVWSAAENLREATEWLLTQDLDARFAVAVPYLRAFARVLGGHYHLRAAYAVEGKGPRMALAQFYINRLLPEHDGLLSQVRVGDKGLYDLSVDALFA